MLLSLDGESFPGASTDDIDYEEIEATLGGYGKYVFHEGRSDCFQYALYKDRDDQIAKRAEEALRYYNKKQGTDYKYVDPVDMNCLILDIGLRVHCNFTARPEVQPRKDGDFSTKLFFAELYFRGGHNYVPKHCRMLSGRKSNIGCGMCPGVVDHPDGYKDDYDYEPPTLRSRGKRKRRESVWLSDSSAEDYCEEDNKADHVVDSAGKVLEKKDETNGENLSLEKFDSCTNAKDRHSDHFKFSLVDDHWAQIAQCAEMGLECYNKKCGTEYKYVESVDINCSVDDRLWVYCKFTAKPKSAPENGASIKLFFAEMEEDIDGNLCVTTCRMLTYLNDPKTNIECEASPRTSGSHIGLHNDQPRNVRPSLHLNAC